MKEIIVIVGTIILAALIFNMIAGDGDGSLKNAAKEQMQRSSLVYEENYQ